MDPIIDITFRQGSSPIYHPSNIAVDYADALQLLQDHKNIEAALVESARGIDPNSDDSKQLNLSVARIRNLVDRIYQTIPIQKRPAPAESAVKAQEVFSTPELLEAIQSYLPVKARWKCTSVQRCWRDTFNGSVKLKRSMGLESFEKHKDFFYSAFMERDFDGPWFWKYRISYGHVFPAGQLFFIRPKSTENDKELDQDYGDGVIAASDNIIKVKIVYNKWRRLSFGSRVRQMLICSGPALTSLEAHVRVENSYTTSLGTITASSPRGITLGDLVDKVAEMKKAFDGRYSYYEIEFKASLTLNHEDPLMIAFRREEELRKQRIESQNERESIRQALMDETATEDEASEGENGFEIDEDDVDAQYRESGSDYWE